MNLRWPNIFALLLGLFALGLVLRYGPQTKAALDAIHHLGPGNSPDDRLAGFMVCGLIGVCIVAIVKILTHNRPQDPNDRGGDHRDQRNDRQDD